MSVLYIYKQSVARVPPQLCDRSETVPTCPQRVLIITVGIPRFHCQTPNFTVCGRSVSWFLNFPSVLMLCEMCSDWSLPGMFPPRSDQKLMFPTMAPGFTSCSSCVELHLPLSLVPLNKYKVFLLWRQFIPAGCGYKPDGRWILVL